jgi:hypothetical protein
LTQIFPVFATTDVPAALTHGFWGPQAVESPAGPVFTANVVPRLAPVFVTLTTVSVVPVVRPGKGGSVLNRLLK